MHLDDNSSLTRLDVKVAKNRSVTDCASHQLRQPPSSASLQPVLRKLDAGWVQTGIAIVAASEQGDGCGSACRAHFPWACSHGLDACIRFDAVTRFLDRHLHVGGHDADGHWRGRPTCPASPRPGPGPRPSVLSVRRTGPISTAVERNPLSPSESRRRRSIDRQIGAGPLIRLRPKPAFATRTPEPHLDRL